MEFISEFPLTVVYVIIFLFSLGLFVYGISVIKQLIEDWLFVQKNKIFFETEQREREMKKNFDKWSDEWKKQSYKYDNFAWDYSYKKRRFPKTKKDFLDWLLLVLLYLILLLIILKWIEKVKMF